MLYPLQLLGAWGAGEPLFRADAGLLDSKEEHVRNRSGEDGGGGVGF